MHSAEPGATGPALPGPDAQGRHCWLMKSEPEVFSIADLQRVGRERGDGVRNYQARNFMRSMQVGDRVLFYHSNAEPSGIAGLAVITATAIPDLSALDPESPYFDAKATPADPRWSMVEVGFEAAFPQVLPLSDLRLIPDLGNLWLFHRARLSVQPVEPRDFAFICQVAASRHG
jgi:predicted RNA-binding protein with PUA-like domain